MSKYIIGCNDCEKEVEYNREGSSRVNAQIHEIKTGHDVTRRKDERGGDDKAES